MLDGVFEPGNDIVRRPAATGDDARRTATAGLARSEPISAVETPRARTADASCSRSSYVDATLHLRIAQ